MRMARATQNCATIKKNEYYNCNNNKTKYTTRPMVVGDVQIQERLTHRVCYIRILVFWHRNRNGGDRVKSERPFEYYIRERTYVCVCVCVVGATKRRRENGKKLTCSLNCGGKIRLEPTGALGRLSSTLPTGSTGAPAPQAMFSCGGNKTDGLLPKIYSRALPVAVLRVECTYSIFNTYTYIRV